MVFVIDYISLVTIIIASAYSLCICIHVFFLKPAIRLYYLAEIYIVAVIAVAADDIIYRITVPS